MTTPAQEPTSPPAGTDLVGQVISGRYLVQKLLGEGGMGAVYLAEHTHMRKRVALKLLHAEMSSDPEVLARFRREAEAAAHVEHPNVASATDFGQTEDGAFFLVLEYVEGTSLRQALGEPLGPVRALHIARQIAFALERAHAAGIVHRDLKPENVMLVKKDEDPDFVKVLDFGIAKVEPRTERDSAQPLTRLGTILGTPEYMAPEQALGETVGPGADLYALGVMLYEMLTGRHPFDADDRMAVLSMHIVAPVPAMADRNPAVDVPPAIEELTLRLLQKDPKLRPPGARELVDEIEAAAMQSGLELPYPTSGRSLGRESRSDLGAPGPANVAPHSTRWSHDDALAKTDYGIPASAPELPATVKTQYGGAPTGGAPALFARATEALARLPRGPLIAAAAAFPVLVLVVIVTLIVALRSPGGEPTAGTSSGGSAKEARSKRAPEAKLTEAMAAGPEALEALAAKYPEDPEVHKQLALALHAAERLDEMLRMLPTLVKLDAIDDEIVQAVVLAAQRPETADDAFAALEGPLGARGFDALLAMSKSKATPKLARSRASKSIARPEVLANASPAATILVEFERAKGCKAKHGLLARVKEDGDARLLSALQPMKSKRGCGFLNRRDCWPCMRKDDALDEAIDAVTARSMN